MTNLQELLVPLCTIIIVQNTVKQRQFFLYPPFSRPTSYLTCSQVATNSNLPLCTLSHSRKTSSLPVHEPPTLSMRHIFNSAAHGASVKNQTTCPKPLQVFNSCFTIMYNMHIYILKSCISCSVKFRQFSSKL